MPGHHRTWRGRPRSRSLARPVHVVLFFWTTVVVVTAGGTAVGASWIFRPSYFSHDPQSGQRMAQYTPGRTPYAVGDATYQQSGYRHRRSSIRGADGSADRLHVVETWGAGEYIRPYGEWLRPFRAGATPYGPWGNPYGPWTQPFDSWANPYGLGRLLPSPYLPGFGRPGFGHPGRPGPWPSPFSAPRGRSSEADPEPP